MNAYFHHSIKFSIISRVLWHESNLRGKHTRIKTNRHNTVKTLKYRIAKDTPIIIKQVINCVINGY